MTDQTLVSDRPYDDYALAKRHNNPLLAAEVARANGLGSDFVSTAAIEAVRNFGAHGYREIAEELAVIFDAELKENYPLDEIERAIAGRPDGEAADAHDERPTDPVHHVLPYPTPFETAFQRAMLPFSVACDASLLDGFEDDEDTLVDVESPFAEDPTVVDGSPDATTDEASAASDSIE